MTPNYLFWVLTEIKVLLILATNTLFPNIRGLGERKHPVNWKEKKSGCLPNSLNHTPTSPTVPTCLEFKGRCQESFSVEIGQHVQPLLWRNFRRHKEGLTKQKKEPHKVTGLGCSFILTSMVQTTPIPEGVTSSRGCNFIPLVLILWQTVWVPVLLKLFLHAMEPFWKLSTGEVCGWFDGARSKRETGALLSLAYCSRERKRERSGGFWKGWRIL